MFNKYVALVFSKRGQSPAKSGSPNVSGTTVTTDVHVRCGLRDIRGTKVVVREKAME